MDSVKQAFFDNLLLLDFDPVQMSSKHYITFNRDVFVMPNHRAFQFITHFLFQRLDKQRCDDAFRHCWPIGDKRAEAEFRKVTTNWLAELGTVDDRDELPMPLPRIVPSLFMSPGGDKFYYLMFCFSRLVLVRVASRDLGVKPHEFVKVPSFTVLSKESPISLQNFVSVGYAMVIAERTQFVQELHLLRAAQNKWIETAERFIESYRGALRADKLSTENLKAELEAAGEEGARLAGLGMWSRRLYSGPGLNTGTPGTGMSGGRLAQKTVAERVRRFWRRIEEMWANGQTVIQLLSDCLADRGGGDGESMWRIEGSKIMIRLPELLVRRVEEETLSRKYVDIDESDEDYDEETVRMSMIQPVDLYDKGRLNLVAVVRFAILALNVYSEQLSAVVGPSGDYDNVVSSKIDQLPDDSKYLRQMIAQLRECRNKATKSTERLHSNVLRILDDTIYRLPATISSLSVSSSASTDESKSKGSDSMSPSYFASNAANMAMTPGNVLNLGARASKKQKATASTGLLDFSGGEHDLELVPMTPMITVQSSTSTQAGCRLANEENHGAENEDLLIDLSSIPR